MPYKRSFAFLNVEVKKLDNIVEALINFDDVKEVHVITEEKDLLVIIETEHGLSRKSQDAIDFVINKIWKLKDD